MYARSGEIKHITVILCEIQSKMIENWEEQSKVIENWEVLPHLIIVQLGLGSYAYSVQRVWLHWQKLSIVHRL